MARHTNSEAIKAILDFLAVHRSIMNDHDINRLNHAVDLLASETITEGKAFGLLEDVKRVVLSYSE